MDNPQTVIGRFYTDVLEEDVESVAYLSLQPGGVHTYHVRPDRESIVRLARMIDGAGLKRRLGSGALSAFSPIPSLLTVLPYMYQNEFEVGTETTPEIITQKSQLRLISRSAGVVHLVSLTADTKVRRVIETRRALPSVINTPTLIDYDTSVPYFTETYIDGRLIGAPQPHNVECYEEVYGQLSMLYESTLQEQVDAGQAISSLLDELEASTLETEIIQDVHRAVDLLEHPEFFIRCRIHGDVNGRNIIEGDDGIYLIDWEGSRIDYPMYDLFRPFLIQYFDTNDPKPIIDAIHTARGNPHAVAFGRTAGTTVYGKKRWYPIAMLLGIIQCLCHIEDDSPLWNRSKEIVDAVLPLFD